MTFMAFVYSLKQEFLDYNPKTLVFFALFGYNNPKQTEGGIADADSEGRIFE